MTAPNSATGGISRRGFFTLLAAAGVSVQFVGRPALAAGDPAGKRKFVTIVCRGGMDGLSVCPPVGDPAYAALRGVITIPPDKALPLDGPVALHPALATVHQFVKAGQARIAPAIATADRTRSHFEAQDVLESGATLVHGEDAGWLNRVLSVQSPSRKVDAISIGPTVPLILRGPAQAASWSPGGAAQSSPRLSAILANLYADDAVLSRTFASGLRTRAMADIAKRGNMATPATPQQAKNAARDLGGLLGRFMTQPNGPQIAVVSVEGFDTHESEGAAEGQLAGRLGYLDAFIAGLHGALGPEWRNTVVVAATEFGRTARVNGTAGTDHGTASSALVLGGALKPGGIIGDWPGLRDGDLFENRDLKPTLDMRALFKGVLIDHMGIDRRALDQTVFPQSAAVAPVTSLA
jgi:uncharacterized protein (DUF1501 family)